ncbi:MAG: thiamine-monophosphate kinase [Chlamydiales bacterium]
MLRRGRGRTVVCVDQTIEGVHFESELPARRVGTKAASRALSDLAATAARPRALLVSLSAPRSTPEAWIRAALRGVMVTAELEDAALVGGDLACAPGPRALSVTAIGEVSARRRAPDRGRARAGDVVLLTGAVGGSLLGRHHRFRARTVEGRWLFERGATAMMDVSDGLAWDLHRLARASGVCVELDDVPVHRDARRIAKLDGRSARWHALHDGEDHELIATVPRARLERLLAEAGRRCPQLSVVGRVRGGSGLHILEGDEYHTWRDEGGWRHGD